MSNKLLTSCVVLCALCLNSCAQRVALVVEKLSDYSNWPTDNSNQERCALADKIRKAYSIKYGQQIRLRIGQGAENNWAFTVCESTSKLDDNTMYIIDHPDRLSAYPGFGFIAELHVIVVCGLVGWQWADNITVEHSKYGSSFGETFNDYVENLQDDGSQNELIICAVHGGEIEPDTDDQAEDLYNLLRSSNYCASSWICKGYGNEADGASSRWHITSTDINPASFSGLIKIWNRNFDRGISFHGFKKDNTKTDDIYVGGNSQFAADVHTELTKQLPKSLSIVHNKAPLQGNSSSNFIHELSVSGVQIEQSMEVRTKYKTEIRNSLMALLEPHLVECKD